MKQIEVQIMQQSYLLGCPEGREAHLLEAVERVDTAMTRIRDAGKVRARERIAVLAALNMAFELADHAAQSLASTVQAQAGVAPLPDAAAPEGAPGSDDQQLQALVQRLDEALGQQSTLL